MVGLAARRALPLLPPHANSQESDGDGAMLPPVTPMRSGWRPLGLIDGFWCGLERRAPHAAAIPNREASILRRRVLRFASLQGTRPEGLAHLAQQQRVELLKLLRREQRRLVLATAAARRGRGRAASARQELVGTPLAPRTMETYYKLCDPAGRPQQPRSLERLQQVCQFQPELYLIHF